MNERIEKLAEQATNYALRWAEGDSKINPKITPEQWIKVFQEKFAELIIAECLNQCYFRGMNDELYAGQLRAAAYIEQHFGVEE